jgi:S1-C subfamily serine protease
MGDVHGTKPILKPLVFNCLKWAELMLRPLKRRRVNNEKYSKRMVIPKLTPEIHNVFTLVISTVFLFLLPFTVLAQTAQEIASKAFGSTVLLVMEDANGQPLSLGSGFFVRDGEIASNLHVVEGAARGYAKLVGQKTKYDIEGITAIDPERDLVVLKISGARAPTLALGNSDAVQVGETVYAVGNPQGLEGTFSQGIVSRIRMISSSYPNIEVGTDKLLQITAPIFPGSSGGPVLNSKGTVIGVSVATFRSGQNLTFAIPSNYLKTLLGEAGIAKPLTQAKLAKDNRSILADLVCGLLILLGP